jgi:hypothetical protein
MLPNRLLAFATQHANAALLTTTAFIAGNLVSDYKHKTRQANDTSPANEPIYTAIGTVAWVKPGHHISVCTDDGNGGYPDYEQIAPAKYLLLNPNNLDPESLRKLELARAIRRGDKVEVTYKYNPDGFFCSNRRDGTAKTIKFFEDTSHQLKK